MQVIIIRLVGHQQHRLHGASEDGGYFSVQVGHTIHHIHYKEDDVGLFHGQHHLFTDLLFKHVVTVHHPSAGINYRELTALPFSLAVLSVAGGASLFIDNRLSGLRQAVE